MPNSRPESGLSAAWGAGNMTEEGAADPPRRSRERMATIAFLSGVALLLLLAVIVTFLALLSIRHEDRASEASLARNALDQLYNVVLDAKTGQRGYLIVGEPAFLEPYHRSLEHLQEAVLHLESSLATAGFLPGQVAELKNLITREEHLLSHPLELAHHEGLEAGRAFVATGQGRQNMERIRGEVETLRHELRVEIAVNSTAARRYRQILVATVIVFLLAAVALSTLEFITFRGEIRSRRRTEIELRRNSRQSGLVAAMADALQAAGGRQESYAVIERYAAALLPEHQGTLYVYSHSRDHLAAAAHWHDSDAHAISPGQFTQEECWALRRGKPHRTGPGLPAPICPHVQDPGRYSLCVPISARGETNSVLNLTLDGACDMAEVDRTAVAAMSLADQLALGLANIELNERLRAQAIRDPLTGLHNRRFLDEVLPRELQRAARENRSLGVLMLDIDHFKRFNDSYGHDAGDAVLRVTAREIESALRESDLVCRYGGEEIVVILPDSDAEATVRVAEKIRTAIRSRDDAVIAAGAPGITVSIGVAVYPDCGTTGEALIRSADAAMYAAKRSGRDRVVAAAPLDGS